MRQAWETGKVQTGFCFGHLRERDNLEDLGKHGNIKMYLLEAVWGAWTGLIWLRIGHTQGSCECSNEALGSIKCR